MIRKLKDKIKHHFKEVLKETTSPHSIAFGFAVGTFIGILPTPGFNILIGLLLVLIFERINKFALFVGMVLWNPLVTPFVILLSYKIGNLIFNPLPVVKYNVVFLDNIYNFSRRLLVGNLIFATFVSAASYFLIRIFLKLKKHRHIRK